MAYAELSLFINGHRSSGSGPVLKVLNPATHEVIGQFAGADLAEVDLAISAAHDAFADWAGAFASDREAILRRAAERIRASAEQIATVIVCENGKPLAEAHAEVAATAEVVDFYAAEARRAYGRTIPGRFANGRMYTLREPLGPVAAFTPWNFPAINLIRKLAPAMAAGCTVVVKPAEETPGTALLIADCFAQAGLPGGVLNVLYGEPSQISTRLIASSFIKKISFTGSTSVGRQLAMQAGAALKRTTMELGGHAPVIVCSDANPELAADKASAAKFRNAGQTCNSASRFYVHRSIYESFANRFVANARKVQLGNGTDASTSMGPLSNGRRIQALTELVDDAIGRGAELLTGGKRIERPGNFFAPTVLGNVPATARIMQQEPFGPVAPMVPFDTLEEAIALANSTPFGLASYVISAHAPTIRTLTTRIQAGIVGVNTFVASLPETPFGGVGSSGWGHEGGPEGIEPYLQTRFINEV